MSIRFLDRMFNRISQYSVPFSFPSYFVKIVGSFNGLLCLSDSGTEVTYLWNSSIRKFKSLAVSVSSVTQYEWVVTGFSHQ